MKEKHRALLMLGLVSFLLPMGEFLILKRSAEPLSMYAFIELALSTYAVYWWYVADKRERAFRAGTIQNVGVILLSIVAVPIYLVRSRGWGHGALAILWVVVVVTAIVALDWAGQLTGRYIAF
jgi:CDP-diglyceride synthetase